MKMAMMAVCAASTLARTCAYGAFDVPLDGAEIAVPAKCAATERARYLDAARELQQHLALIAGRTLPIASNGASRAGFAFHVGEAPKGVVEAFAPEEARWSVTEKGAWFYGAQPFGANNAVYAFLEDELGVRWPWHSNVAYRVQIPLRVRHDEGRWTPSVAMRNLRSSGYNLAWRARMRNGRHDGIQYGHAFTGYLKRFLKMHPEYFAMRADGKRLPPNAPKGVENVDDIAEYLANAQARYSMCMSSTGLIAQIVSDWKAAGAKEWVNICENDASGANVCKCPACTALDVPPPEGAVPWWNCWYADRYVHFGNAVLAEARKIRPDAKACFYAYNATEQAPRRERLADGLAIGLVPTQFSTDAVKKYVREWKAAGLKTFFWRPNRHGYYNFTCLPMGTERHFFDIMKFLVAEGCVGFDYDCAAKHLNIEFFMDYVLYKGMQDISKDFAYWEDHYMQAFGAAKDDVRAWYRYWREEVFEKRLEPQIPTMGAKYARSGDFGICAMVLRHPGDFYSPDDFTRAGAFLSAGLARPGLEKQDRERVEELVVANEHARLFVEAVARKSPKNMRALYDFRKRHGLELVTWAEDHYGDLTGIREFIYAEHPDEISDRLRAWNAKRRRKAQGRE